MGLALIVAFLIGGAAFQGLWFPLRNFIHSTIEDPWPRRLTLVFFTSIFLFAFYFMNILCGLTFLVLMGMNSLTLWRERRLDENTRGNVDRPRISR